MTLRSCIYTLTLAVVLHVPLDAVRSQDLNPSNRAPRTAIENKLGGNLLAVLREAEEADTSIVKAEQLKKYLERTERNTATKTKGDGLHIRVTVFLWQGSDSTAVINLIKSQGGEISLAGQFPAIDCSIPPKAMRVLINSPLVKSVEKLSEGFHRGMSGTTTDSR